MDEEGGGAIPKVVVIACMGCCCCCSSEADKDESASEREGSSSVEVDVVRREEREREREVVLTEGRRRDLDFVVLLVFAFGGARGSCQASRAPSPSHRRFRSHFRSRPLRSPPPSPLRTGGGGATFPAVVGEDTLMAREEMEEPRRRCARVRGAAVRGVEGARRG